MAEGGGALREILAVFDISANTEELEKAGKKIEGFKDKLIAIAKVGLEAFAVDAIKEFVQSQVEVANELDRTAQRLGITTAEVEKYNLAAGLSGVSTEAMSNGLRVLERNMGNAVAKGGEAAGAFHALHVKLQEGGKTRDAGKVFEELAERFAGIQDPAKKARLAMELFGHQGTMLIPILNKGRDGFREAEAAMAELGGATSQNVIESAKRIEEQAVKLSTAWGNLKMMLASQLFPIFEKFVRWGTEITKVLIDVGTHTNVLSTGLIFLGAVASYKAATGVGALLKTLGLLKPSLWETLAALAEFALPILIIGGLYVAFDELYTLMNGGDTVIGRTLDALFGLGTAAQAAEALRDGLHGVWIALLEIKNVLVGIPMALIESLGDLADGDTGKAGKRWSHLGHEFADPENADADEADADESAAETKTTADIKNMYARKRAEKVDAAERKAHPGKKGADPHSFEALDKADKAERAHHPGVQGADHNTKNWRHEAIKRLMGSGKWKAEDDQDRSEWAAQFPNLAAEQTAHRRPVGSVRVAGAFGGGGGGGRSIVQQIHNEIKINTADNPKAVGVAAAKGASEGAARSNDKLAQTKT